MTAHAIPALPGRRRAAPWFIVEGLLLVVLGVMAAVLPGLAGIAGGLVFGWLLVLSGVFGVVSYFGARGHAHMLWALLSALVAIVAGAAIVWQPLIGAGVLALFIAAYLTIDGVALIALAFDQRRRGARSWFWLVISGGVDLLLGGFIIAMGVLGDAVLVGFIIAIDLVVAGIAMTALGWAARKA